MKYGITLPDRGPLARPEELNALAGKAEELGYDNILVSEHIVIPRRIDSVYPNNESGEFPGGPSGEAMEQLTLLSFLAGRTSKIRLATGVNGCALPQPFAGRQGLGHPGCAISRPVGGGYRRSAGCERSSSCWARLRLRNEER